MPNVNITPQTVLLTSGQAVTFEATDSTGHPISVSWGLNPPIGALVTAAGGNAANTAVTSAAPSATYVAPPVVASAQTIAVIAASTANDSASATISLTSETITIVPAKVDLKAEQEQQFLAIVAGAPGPDGNPPEKVTWILSPPLGSLEQTGLYHAPPEIPDSTTVNVTASIPARAKPAVATINLASPPWRGPGVNLLGGFLLVVFSLVFLMVGLWPPALPSPDTAKANRIDAEKTWEDAVRKQKADRAEAEKALKEKKRADAEKSNTRGQSTGSQETKTEEKASNVKAGDTSAAAADADDAAEVVKEAHDDWKYKEDLEEKVNDADVHPRLVDPINRELDLLLLVLLAGCLGSFLHLAQSYSEFVGNRTLKSSWAWWYSLGPFIGAGLALVFYAAIRGGVMAVSTGSNAKASELNPFGLVSVAAMVGMFSKPATIKLGEVFDTLFKSDKAKESKDPVVDSSQTSQLAGKAVAGGNAASTASK
jgi:hypothetical protein